MTQYSKPEAYKKPETTLRVETQVGTETPREKIVRKAKGVIPHTRYKLKSYSEFV